MCPRGRRTIVGARKRSYKVKVLLKTANFLNVSANFILVRKDDESKDSFYEELERVFDHFPRYDRKITLGDFNAN